MILGVDHTAWNYQSPTISSQSTNDTTREHTSRSASLLFSQQRKNRTFLLPITTVAPKTLFTTVSHPNITDNHDPINITTFSITSFDYLLRCLLHGTSRRHNYTQPYGVNLTKRNAPLFILTGLLPIIFQFTAHFGQPYIYSPHK